MKKQFGEYYLGLDIGTDSVGWAVTNDNYEILKFNKKAMWGIHLFDSGKTAEERRLARTSRRRTERSKERIGLLRELFANEISKVDTAFFERLDESKYWLEDKSVKQRNALFNDDKYKDRDFFNEFPTIYHLRSQLVHDSKPRDVRLVYLALHHIIKHRGHFLFEGQDFAIANSFKTIFDDLINSLNDYGITFNITNYSAVEELLKNKKKGIKDKKRILTEILNANEKPQKAVCDLMAGATVKLSDLFADESLDDSECAKISFSSGIEEKLDALDSILGENMYIVEKIKAIYDWSVLVDILGSNQFISDAKKDIYDEHAKDLKLLKQMIKQYAPNKYNEIFKDSNQKFNYCTYVGKPTDKTKPLLNPVCLQEDFCKYIRAIIEKVKIDDRKFDEVLEKLSNNTFLPKQVSKNNSVIPYQLNQKELVAILNNSSKYLPFLNDIDNEGISIKNKVESILTFKIPYYVGPLNSHSQNSWIVKKSEGKVYPWNFEKFVDEHASATKFIERMTNMCTYLVGMPVIPKDSILYSKFTIYNQLNNIKVNGEKLPIEIKNKMFKEKFLDIEKATVIKEKAIKEYLKAKNIIDKVEDVQVTGIDGEIKGTMKSYVDFKHILGNNFDEQMVDEIIRKIVILGDSKKMLKANLKSEFGTKLNDAQINEISKQKYAGWGRLSRKFLSEIYHIDESTGEYMSIMNALEKTDCNLMQLLSNEYDFLKKISEFNAYANNKSSDITYKDVEELYVSPAVKRSIWRTIVIAKEIRKVTGHDPKKIFVEMARGEEESKKGKRTISRKDRLLDLYKNCQADAKELFDSLEKTDESRLNGDKLFLYYIQMGRCMYSGERIDLDELQSEYDIDHIYPQSKVKDDSLSNRVLVRKTINGKKSDRYPIPEECVTAQARELWRVLKQRGFIDDEKYNRLIRKNAFTENELSGFIARQLVETRQSSKAVADLLGKMFEKGKIVYVKAGNVSRFRQENEFIKCRAINDYHHAKDAYLNIVVGNVYDEKFTSNPINFIKSGETYSLNQVFRFDVKRNGKTAWNKEESLETVKKVISKNNILFTRFATETKGVMFDLMPKKKGNGQLPLKSSDERLKDISKYGGYNSVKGAYFSLVQHEIKGKKVKSIEFVPIYLTREIENNPGRLLEYFTEDLQLKSVKILIPKIKINTLFCVDGFYMHLSGRTSNQLVFKGANQLIVDDECVKYLKIITSYLDKCKDQKKELIITEHTKISLEENKKILKDLISKFKNSLYSNKLNAAISNLENGYSKFEMLNLYNQCKVIGEILNLARCTPVAANLSLIGGPSSCGILVLNKDITKQKSIYIINQSPTGLFEERKDLSVL